MFANTYESQQGYDNLFQDIFLTNSNFLQNKFTPLDDCVAR